MDFHNFWIPELDTHRTIRVYLPPSYASGDRYYSVLYMHDGQNLFDDKDAYARAWRVGKIMDSMPVKKQAIIVGIDNGGEQRLNEYAPFKRGTHGGKGDLYAQFIVQVLKPFIDRNYRTLPTADHTWVVGSSMGGLISFYMGLKYPNIFGKVGVLSPAFWFNPSILALNPTDSLNNSYFYIVGSKTESSGMLKTLQASYWRLKDLSVPDDHFVVIARDRGGHNESFWSREFKKMYSHLIKI